MNRKERFIAKQSVLAELKSLLDCVPGAETPWGQIQNAIYHLSLETISALLYRVRIARTQSYDEGVEYARRVEANT